MTEKPGIWRSIRAELSSEGAPGHVAERHTSPQATLAAALLGFFIITLDAVVVNVALPAVGHEFGGGLTGLQWIKVQGDKSDSNVYTD